MATLGTWGSGRLIQVAAYSLGPGSTLREKGEKKNIGKQSELRGSLGRRKGGRAWRHAFDAADPPSSHWLVIEMSTHQVVIIDVSMSLLCHFCKKIFEFEMK